MTSLQTIKPRLLTLTALALWVAGCATLDVNPPQAQANTGYVDFHAEASAELSWEVVRFDDRTQSFRNLFSDLKPPTGGVLRLALAPGHHRLRATLLNRVVTVPAVVEVEVQAGCIIPVRITVTEAGTGLVETREENRGGTSKGRYGRRTRVRGAESVVNRLSAEVGASVPYQVKAQMPYAR